MNRLSRWWRQHLAVKLFFAHLLVIAAGAITLLAAGESVAPKAFDRHLATMGRMMQRLMQGGMMGRGPYGGAGYVDLNADLFHNFHAALNEAMVIALLVSGAAAVVVSWIVSRRIVAPIQAMSRVSRRIAEGHYEERVAVSPDAAEGTDELGELALNFNRMAERLARTEAARRQWLADISHEMRTPLASIRAYAEGLQDGVFPPEPEIYQQIVRETKRLQRLVDDLHELSRLEAGAYTLNRHPVAPKQLVDEVLQRFAPAYADKGVALQSEVPDQAPAVWADAERIIQVLSNLLDNALRHTPPGGQVTVRVIPPQAPGGEKGWVRFEVQDTGEGIPPEHLPRLFHRFYRVDKSRSRRRGGSGIGLTIARLLVEAHDGRIEAHSPGPVRAAPSGSPCPSPPGNRGSDASPERALLSGVGTTPKVRETGPRGGVPLLGMMPHPRAQPIPHDPRRSPNSKSSTL